MGGSANIHPEMNRIIDQVRGYWLARLDGNGVTELNEAIRQLRILIQETLTGAILALSLPKAREFRLALSDQLYSACNGIQSRCSKEDHDHHYYCVKEIVACFEWAEQIKEEIPDDPLTQKILAVDIPILRPFDYGLSKAKPVKRR